MEFPHRFGKYTLLKRIATGGMAEIFLARQEGMSGFEKDVVVKRLLPTHAQNQELVSMFLDEARIAAHLTHPNIAQIFDLGRIDDDYFIAMEYVDGVDLRRLCQQGIAESDYLPLQHAVRIIAEVCDALAYAHTRTDKDGKPLSIVHRDVSPTNILVTFEGAVKLVDFGIAKAANKATVTRAGQIKGKFGYMAPEQCRGDALDARTDIFAAGINLYEITLGRRLFRGETELETLEAIEACRVPPPRSAEARYPEALERVVMKALAREPGERYATARDMQMALEDFLAEAGLRSTAGMLAEYMKRLFREQLELDAKEGVRLRELARSAQEEEHVAESDENEKGPAGAPPEAERAPQAAPEQRGGRAVADMEQWGAINTLPPAAPENPARKEEKPIPDLVPSVQLDEDDLKIRKPRSYSGLLLLLLISAGVYGLVHVMEEDMTTQRTRGNPNIQVAPPKLTDLAKADEDLPPAAPPKKTLVRIESNPPGARVLLNGNVLSGLTPTAVQSFSDRWVTAQVLLPGYLPAEQRVKISGESADLKFDLVEGKPETGSLRIESAPAGATVTLNGTDVGATPLELPAVAANASLSLRIAKEGHYPHVVSYRVPPGLRGAVAVRLVPDAGPRTMAVVNVESIPEGAQVSEVDANGKAKVAGRTSRYPVKINARIEDHVHLRAEAERFEVAETFLDVREAFYTVYLRLPAPEKFYGNLSILGAKGMMVYVGSEELGATPIDKHQLSEGAHSVVLVDPKTNHREEFTVDVRRNETVQKSVVVEEGRVVIR